MPSPRRLSIAYITLGFVLLGLLARTVRYLLNFPLWGDEAFLATNFFTRDFAGMLRPLEYGQIAPLGFMWIELAATKLLGLSEWALRFFPCVIGLGSMLLFWRFARRLLPRRTAMLAIAVFAASYFPMRYGVELKPYGLDLFISLLLAALCLSVLKKPDSSMRWARLMIAGALSPWFSYPSAFIGGAVALAILLEWTRSRRRIVLVGAIAYGAVLLASFWTMYFLYARPQFSAASWLAELPMWTSAFPPLTHPLKFVGWLIDTHTGELLAYPIGGKHGASTVPFLLALVGAFAIGRRSAVRLVLLLGPLALTFIAAALHKYPYGGGPRVSLYMAPAFCILIGAGLAALIERIIPPRRMPRALIACAGLFALIAVIGIVRDIVKPYQSISEQRCRAAIRTLASQTRPHDRWATFNSLTTIPYAPDLYGWGGSGATFRYYVNRLAPAPVDWAPLPNQFDSKPEGRMLLLVYHDNKVSFPKEQFAVYLSQCGAHLHQGERRLFTLDGFESIEVYAFGR